MLDEGFFDIEQFFQELAISETDQAAVVDCLVRGVAAYYRHLYSFDKYGEYPADMVAERMYEPYIFGFGAVEVVRCPSLPSQTQLKVVLYTLHNTYPSEEYGTPHGIPVLLSFLARVGVLKIPVFRLGMQISTIDRRDLFDDWSKDEVYDLINWLIESPMQPSELVWWMQHFFSFCDKPQLGKGLIEHLLQHATLSVEFKRDLCWALLSEKTVGTPPGQWQAMEAMLSGNITELKAILSQLPPEEQELLKFDPTTFEEFSEDAEDLESSFGLMSSPMFGAGYLRMLPPYIKRQSISGLAQLGEDPLTLCETYLVLAKSHGDADAFNQGVADVIRMHHQDMPQDSVRKFVEEGLQRKSVPIRKTFYQLGADLFGSQYWTRAQKDNAKSIQTWAAKKVAGTQSLSKRKKQSKP